MTHCTNCTTVSYFNADAIREFAIWSAKHNDREDLLVHCNSNHDFFVRCWGFEEMPDRAGYLRRCEACEALHKRARFPETSQGQEPYRLAQDMLEAIRTGDFSKFGAAKPALPAELQPTEDDGRGFKYL